MPTDLMGRFVRKLVGETDDERSDIRIYALEALGRLKENIPKYLIEDVLRKLIEKLEDDLDGVKICSMQTLEKLTDMPETLKEEMIWKELCPKTTIDFPLSTAVKEEISKAIRAIQ